MKKCNRTAKNHDTITLEPGCQIEISAKPEKQLYNSKTKLML